MVAAVRRMSAKNTAPGPRNPRQDLDDDDGHLWRPPQAIVYQLPEDGPVSGELENWKVGAAEKDWKTGGVALSLPPNLSLR